MRLKVQGQDNLRRVARQIREAGRTDLRREMLREMRAAGREILADQRDEVRRLVVTGQPFRSGQVPARRRPASKSTGLRDEVARSLALEIRTAGQPRVSFVARGDRMPAGKESLPRHLDNPRGWRHPVFSNREMWVAQRGGSWFWPPIKRKIRVFRERIDRAVTTVVETIERG